MSQTSYRVIKRQDSFGEYDTEWRKFPWEKTDLFFVSVEEAEKYFKHEKYYENKDGVWSKQTGDSYDTYNNFIKVEPVTIWTSTDYIKTVTDAEIAKVESEKARLQKKIDQLKSG